MKFTVLSHAGLLIQSKSGKSLVCDPWLVGSSYWRSWWNYPPVSKELVNSLKPDVIYLTHIHWDHFHGPSLEKFDKDTLILVPKGNYDRNKVDLIGLGFTNIKELRHGETYLIDNGFQLTSYQFGVFLDSAPMIECDGVKLLNLNDSKHMGPTLRQIINRHPAIDFVFRSHSSANSRLSYEIVDEQTQQHSDDIDKYVREFAETVLAVGAKYAIPFASNHCHLHKDSWHYNRYVQTPLMVQEYFQQHHVGGTELKVMVSGDSWSSETGFYISPNTEQWFLKREENLLEYRENQHDKLEEFYNQEDRIKLSKRIVEKYYADLAKKLPFFLKRKLKDVTYTYVLYKAGKPGYIYNINVATGTVTELPAETPLDYGLYPIQIHTTAFIFIRCIAFRIFSHMSIGKRVFYRVSKAGKPKMELLNSIYNLDEYDMLPLKRILSKRSLETWMLRWRELLLYAMLVRDRVFYGRFRISRYLKPRINVHAVGNTQTVNA